MGHDLQLTVRAGNPDFLDLPWETPLERWPTERFVDLPQGISRHSVRFLRYPQGIYAIKELPLRAASTEYGVLRALERLAAPAVRPAGLVAGRNTDPHAEWSAALITFFASFAFPYRHLVTGPGLGPRRGQLLDAFARLLVQLHLAGCFWGDCSLSNVLYRWDAEAIQPIMVDAETSQVHDELTEGQRNEDLEIMVGNVAGGMADIAASRGAALDDADLRFGEDVANRYRILWDELTKVEEVPAEERHRIGDRIQRLGELGFDVDELVLKPTAEGHRVSLRVRVGGRRFHARRLKDLTGIDALESQARQILADLQYYLLARGITPGEQGTRAGVAGWRAQEFEPTIDRLTHEDEILDPVQAYCDLLHFRFTVFEPKGKRAAIGEVLEAWLEAGRPGYPLPD